MKQKIKTRYGNTKVYSSNGGGSPESTPVFVVPGFSESNTHTKQLVDALSARGHRSETFSPPRKSDRATRKANDAIQRQGDVVLSVLEATHSPDEPVHAVTHSLGSAAVLRAAQQAPERFASITMMEPLGMTERQSFGRLAFSAIKKTFSNQRNAMRGQSPDSLPAEGYAARIDSEPRARYAGRVFAAQAVAGGVIGKRAALAYKEARDSGSYDMASDVAKVTESGIPVHVVTAYGDEMFNRANVEAAHVDIGDRATSHSTVADREAAHDTFWMQPERTAEIADQIIRNE